MGRSFSSSGVGKKGSWVMSVVAKGYWDGRAKWIFIYDGMLCSKDDEEEEGRKNSCGCP